MIVVIGILAAITIVTFTGIQARAYNAQQLSSVNSYIKILGLYKAQNGSLPTQYGCLGSGNIDSNNDGTADCGDNGADAVNQTLLNQLAPFGNHPKAVTSGVVGTDGISRRGIKFESSQLVWFLNNTNDCGIPGSARGSSGPSVWCTLPNSAL